MTMEDRYGKAIFILQHTNDGDNLVNYEEWLTEGKSKNKDVSPYTCIGLWLVQEAVNNHLSDVGLKIFDKLYHKILQERDKSNEKMPT